MENKAATSLLGLSRRSLASKWMSAFCFCLVFLLWKKKMLWWGGWIMVTGGNLALFPLEDLFSVLSDFCCSCRWKSLWEKQTPHGACKCFCTTCKAFLEVASKKRKKGFYHFKKKCNCVIVYICNSSLFSLHHSGNKCRHSSSSFRINDHLDWIFLSPVAALTGVILGVFNNVFF